MNTRTLATTLMLMATGAAGPAIALDATSADNLAAAVLSQIGKTRGVCELPAVGDGQLARAFAQTSQMTVHAMCPDTAGTRVVRNLLEPTGLVGIRVYVEKGTPAVIPLATNYADLLVITNLVDAGLASIPVAEVVRALIPGGKAFVGRATSEGAGLSTSALQSWVTGRSDATVTTDAQGTWAIITKQKPTNVDEWTHSMHGADNNPYSSDSVLSYPFLPQWRLKPYMGQNRHGLAVTGGGRLYQVENINHGASILLRAIRIYNGQLLWEKQVGALTGTCLGWESSNKGSYMVTVGSALYMVDHNKVDKLDGETGALSSSITCDAVVKNEVKWIAVDGGMLCALIGDTALDTVAEGGYKKIYYGTTISAYNLSSGAQVWTHAETGTIDARAVGISAGKLFYVNRGVKVVALNAVTGVVAWSTNAAATMTLLNAPVATGGTDPVATASGFLCSPTVVLIGQPEQPNLVALSATDGSLLWSTTRSGNRSQAKVVLGNGVLLARDISDASKQSWNVVTSQAAPQYAGIRLGLGCGMISASPDGVFGNAGGESHSFRLGRDLPWQRFKTSCDIPMLVSDGLGINPNNTDCVCERGNRALIAEAPAGSFVFDQQAVQAQRLELGPAAGNLSAAVTVDSLDWATHRANIARSGSVAVNLASQHNLIWRYQRPHPYNAAWSVCSDTLDQENTPPVTAGTLAFWGGTDGYVRCYDMTAKAERWNYATGGRILATPTVANGCVYVGSMDGYAYCIEAGTGRLVWRFRAAPVDRRINLYGSLASCWPVNSGVIVQNGDAYFAAGSAEGGSYGAYVCALNASTGAIVWQNTSSGSVVSQPNGNLQLSPSGYMTIAGGRLWVTGSWGRPGLFELANGRFDSLSGDLASSQGGLFSPWGREIGVVDNTHVIVGGRIQFADQGERGYWFGDRSKNPIDCFQLDANGQPGYPQIHIGWNIARAPAWDNTSFYMATGPIGNPTGNPARWSISSMVGKVDAMRAAHPAANYVWWQQMAESADTTGLAQWTATAITDMNGIALASDGVVVLNAHKANNDDPQSNWTWYLSVLSPASGAVQWSVQLPCAPTHEGLAIARDGTILVSLSNGDVCGYGAGQAVSVLARAPSMSAPSADRTFAAAIHSWSAMSTASAAVASGAVAPTVVSPITGLLSTRTSASPRPSTVAADDAAMKATFPLKDSIAATTNGTSALLQSIPTFERPAATYHPRDMTWNPERPCLPVASVKASSSVAATRPLNTTDRDLTTRWSPLESGSQSITYDLGAVQEVSAVSVVWYSVKNSRTGFAVETSTDGKRFEKIDEGLLMGRGSNTALRTFLAQQARFVRLGLQPVDSSTHLSVYEVGIHGGAGEERRAEAVHPETD